MEKTAAVPKTTLAAPRRLAPRKYHKTPSAIPTAPADRFTLAPRVATTKPPALMSSPITQQILPKSSFSKPSCLSLCTVPSCCISSYLSSGLFVLRYTQVPDILFSSKAVVNEVGPSMRCFLSSIARGLPNARHADVRPSKEQSGPISLHNALG